MHLLCYLARRVHIVFQEMMQMHCQWQQLLDILPVWLRPEVDRYGDKMVQEVRLRLGQRPGIRTKDGTYQLEGNLSTEDILWVINLASRYSPWNAESMAKGYLTAPGGHRIGLCGRAVIREGKMTGLREITSLNIRVARDMGGIARGLGIRDSFLILGAPGWGKTTLLRDVIRQLSREGNTVGVVDERMELFPSGFFPGEHSDVLLGCPKVQGIEMVLRTMTPDWIAVDEITDPEDCQALLRAGWCGVKLVATAHASSVADLKNRSIYRPLVESGLFSHIVLLHPDKGWTQERMAL